MLISETDATSAEFCLQKMEFLGQKQMFVENGVSLIDFYEYNFSGQG